MTAPPHVPGIYLAVYQHGDSHFLHYLDETDPDVTGAWKLDTATVTGAFDALRPSLPVPLMDAGQLTEDNAVDRALAHPDWADPDRGARALTGLAEAVLPEQVVHRLTTCADHAPVRLKIGPNGSWAQLPWELLPLPGDGRRLLEVADIQTVPPVSLVVDRKRVPRDPQPGATALYVLDPNCGSSVLPAEINRRPNPALAPWRARVAAASGWVRGDGDPPPVHRNSPDQPDSSLGHQLRRPTPPSRLLYYGHCYTPKDAAPAGTGLVLSDPGGRDWPDSVDMGYRNPRRMLTAGTLIQGEDGTPGHSMWPMPPRVALIACSSGTDAAAHEPWGLAAATINAGAEFMTGTRWILPADVLCAGATSVFAQAVDDAHQQADPIAAHAAWIRGQYQAWTAAPRERRHHPVVWASALTYLARRHIQETATNRPGGHRQGSVT